MVERDVPEDKIKRAIASLPDVQSCNVDFGPDGSIEAIHIVSSSKRAPKQIVRDVESVLAADCDIRLDHRKISIARVEEKEERKVAKRERPRLAAIRLSISGGRGSAEVELERAGLAVTGEASGVSGRGGMLRLVVAATFRALEKLIGADAAFELLDVMRVQSGERRAVVVLANLTSGIIGKSLAGCVQFEDDEPRAAALAALDASNRMIEGLNPPERTEYEVTPLLDE